MRVAVPGNIPRLAANPNPSASSRMCGLVGADEIPVQEGLTSHVSNANHWTLGDKAPRGHLLPSGEELRPPVRIN